MSVWGRWGLSFWGALGTPTWLRCGGNKESDEVMKDGLEGKLPKEILVVFYPDEKEKNTVLSVLSGGIDYFGFR